MQYVLVLQWSATSAADYDALIEMEDSLHFSVERIRGSVDGHDFGSGEMNIYILTDQPLEAFEDAKAVLGPHERWSGARGAYRRVDVEHYIVV